MTNPLNAFMAGQQFRQQRDARDRAEASRNAFLSANDALRGGDRQGAISAARQSNDPAVIADIQAQIAQMDERQRTAASESLEALSGVGFALLNTPPEQRRAFLQQNRSMLEGMGIQGGMLDSFDPSDEAIRAVLSQNEDYRQALATGLESVTLGQNDTRVNQLTGAQTVGAAGVEARALEAGQNAETERSNRADEALRGRQIALDEQNAPLERQGEQFAQERQIRQEFNQITSDWRSIEQQYGVLQSAAGMKTAQGDLALVVAFTKLLDPGSVAREGEVQLTQSTASAVQQASNWLSRLQRGDTVLPDDVRNAFIAAADEMASVYGESYNRRRQEYGEIAGAYSLDRSRAVPGQPYERPIRGPQQDDVPRTDDGRSADDIIRELKVRQNGGL